MAARAIRGTPALHVAKVPQSKESRGTKPIHWATTLVLGLALASSHLEAQQPASGEQRGIDSLVRAPRAPQRSDSLEPSKSLGEAGRGARTPQQSQQAPPARPGMYMNIGFSGLMDAGWSSTADVPSLQRGDHDPAVRGFTIPNEEITLDGAVDPYFKGFLDVVYKIDPEGESALELEEAYVLTTSLPANLQLRAGQFYTEFGRQNQQHPHSWAFVDQPLVLNRMFGPDGMRGQGARLSWLAPTSWYTEAMVSVLNSLGETMYSFRSEESSEIHGGIPVERGVRDGGDMVVVPRVATSFDLTPTQTVLLGFSGAVGPNNSGTSTNTRVYGADLYWRWKSATAGQGFPFLSWQSEVLYRRYDAAERQSEDNPLVTLPRKTIGDRGAYSQVLWGIRPRIVAGLRAEVAGGDATAFDSELRVDRVRVSPNFTLYPSEFSKVRLQYNFDDRKGIGRDHSIWLQFEFIMGAHAAHRF
jgi:hypothetical protein